MLIVEESGIVMYIIALVQQFVQETKILLLKVLSIHYVLLIMNLITLHYNVTHF